MLMHRGHDPRDIEQYAWRDVEAYLTLAPLFVAAGNPFIDPQQS